VKRTLLSAAGDGWEHSERRLEKPPSSLKSPESSTLVEPDAIVPLALAVLIAAQKRRELKRRGRASPARVEALAAVSESGAALLLEALEGRSVFGGLLSSSALRATGLGRWRLPIRTSANYRCAR
jgi:hypothetical protein